MSRENVAGAAGRARKMSGAGKLPVTVYGMDISFIFAHHFYDHVRSLPQPLQDKICKCRNYQDRCRRLAGYLLLRKALREKRGTELSKVQYMTEPGGKPYLADVEGFHFNISHSGCLAVCAASEEPVGIDIQEQRNIRPGLAEKFFTGRENELLLCCDLMEERDALFFRIWCAKEAYVKWSGKGLAGGISDLETDVMQGLVWRAENDGAALEETKAFLAEPDLSKYQNRFLNQNRRSGEAYYLMVCSGKPMRIQMKWEV